MGKLSNQPVKCKQTNKKSKKLVVKLTEPQIETKLENITFTQAEKRLKVMARKQEFCDISKSIPKVKELVYSLLISFPKGASNYKSAILEVTNVCDNACFTHSLKFGIESSKDSRKINLLKLIKVEGKNLTIRLRKSDSTRRSVRIVDQSVDKEVVKEKFGAESIEASSGSRRKEPIYYILTFKNSTAANKADKKKFSLKDIEYKVTNHLVDGDEAEFMEDSSTEKDLFRQVIITFPVGSSNHKAAVLKILKLWDEVASPNKVNVSCKSSEEAEEKMSLLRKITAEGKKLTLRQRISDPLRRVIIIREKGKSKNGFLKLFDAYAIERMNLGGLNNNFYVLSFRNKEAASAADKNVVNIRNKNYRVRNFYYYGNKLGLGKAPHMRKQEVVANIEKIAQEYNEKRKWL